MAHVTELIARYAETDQMGIIHHSVYPVWFEAARTEFIKELGVSYSNCEKKGLRLPLIELKCKYIKPAYYEDVILVEASVTKATPVRLVISYTVRNKEDGNVLAMGYTTHVWTDTNRKPVNMKKKAPDILEMMKQSQNE
jgi:acyl-CoA thioester hydrolase